MTGSSTVSEDYGQRPIAVETEDLVCGYDGRDVLHGVTLRVPVGGFLGLVGPNGSGKTTLLRALAGIVRPTRGTVRVMGQPVGMLSPRALARTIAVVPQSLETVFAFTVEEIVAMGRYPHLRRLQPQSAADRDIVERALRDAGIEHVRDRPVTEISGGERQLAVIARALAQEAQILLLDEPTSQLDLAHQREVMRLLLNLNRARGTTMIMVSHDLNLAAAHCDTLAVLSQGRLHSVGPPATVLNEETVATVYGVESHVAPHPLTGQPHLYLLPISRPSAPDAL